MNADPLSPRQDVDTMLSGTRLRAIMQELLTNSLYFPMVLILLEMIPEWPDFFSTDIASYALVVAVAIQAYLLGSWQYAGQPRPLLGNLIAPLLYTVVEVALEGMEFFEAPRHIAFWAFALVIGFIQQLRLSASGVMQGFLILLENVFRTSILLMGYWIFEMGDLPTDQAGLAAFLADDSHIFIALATLFLGLMVGFANLNAQTYLERLRQAAGQLRTYSGWLLGRSLLSQALSDPTALAVRRQERAVLFIDIRGFTAWSENQTPEKVLQMLNQYFEAGELIWNRYQAIKAKPSADEIMVIFADTSLAVKAALDMRHEMERLLRGYQLSAGIGVHYGALVEGVMGSSEVKGYDVIGDVVNTAKRICDQAQGGEVLVSRDALFSGETTGGAAVQVGEARSLLVRGKEQPLLVFPLKV